MTQRVRVGVVGARGHVGQELVPLLRAHPNVELVFAASRSDEPVEPSDVARHDVGALILALPNGHSTPYVDAFGSVVIDLSADNRFHNDDNVWVYGLPERTRAALKGARRIANPGCYATGAQLALAPFLDVMEGVPTVFGVSGYSGAGTQKSDKNDPDKLRDNLIPYGLTDHTHEREISKHLGREVAFMPHVAPFFRGITLTVTFDVKAGTTAAHLSERLRAAYANEALVHVQEAAPHVRDAAGQHGVTIGGLALDARGRRAVIVCTLDNLLKGAATQAVQNLNLAFGFPETTGIPLPPQRP